MHNRKQPLWKNFKSLSKTFLFIRNFGDASESAVNDPLSLLVLYLTDLKPFLVVEFHSAHLTASVYGRPKCDSLKT